MGRRNLIAWKCLGRRHHGVILFLAAAAGVALLTNMWWFTKVVSSALLPALPMHDLRHLRKERNLKRYLDSIQLLIEPTFSGCEAPETVPLLVLVSSAPLHIESREAIRQTWGGRLHTFFVLGLDRPNTDDELVDLYIEAKLYSDMLVFDLADNYQNLTLKTGLMLQWSLRRCPQAEALLKTDDDVLVNPWMMMRVVREHEDHQLIGYMKNRTRAHRDDHSKWYLPRWLYPSDTIAEYLSGTGYIINGEYIERILKKAYQVPIINLEDIFFTQMVAKDMLSLTLTHDRRLSAYKPWIRSSCSWWGLALAHSLGPKEIVVAWAKISELGEQLEKGNDVCAYFSFLSNDFFLY